MKDIQPGTWWNHNREGYAVRIAPQIVTHIVMKDANDAGWQHAVVYVRDGDERVFVRSAPDFLSKFTQDERLGDEE